jgi:hypothetical protein
MPLMSTLGDEQIAWIQQEPGLVDHLIELSAANEESAREDRLRLIALRDGSGRNCATCGESFFAARSDAFYCSARCRQKAYRQRADA